MKHPRLLLGATLLGLLIALGGCRTTGAPVAAGGLVTPCPCPDPRTVR